MCNDAECAVNVRDDSEPRLALESPGHAIIEAAALRAGGVANVVEEAARATQHATQLRVEHLAIEVAAAQRARGRVVDDCVE